MAEYIKQKTVGLYFMYDFYTAQVDIVTMVWQIVVQL